MEQDPAVSVKTKLPAIEQSIFSHMTALANKHGAINLAQGFPDFHCPPHLVERVHRHMVEGRNQYAPMAGVPALRERIAEKIKQTYQVDYSPDSEVTVTSGATHAIYTAITALVKEKDEVILFEPAYDSYLPAVLLNRAAPKYVALNAPDYKINWDTVKKMISSRTRLIILNTPHNPTGTMLTEADMQQLAKLVKGKDIFILSDEVYEHIWFDQPHRSICQHPELAGRSVVVSSFGKTYHTTGWKTGYAVAPAAITEEIRKVLSYNMFSGFTPVQHAYADILGEADHYLQLPDFYRKKRDLFRAALEGSAFKLLPCEGGYFQLAEYSAISEEGDRKFCEWLTREMKVAAVPVSAFFHDKVDMKVVRFCFAKNDDTLLRAAEVLCKVKP